ncbi:hypothetical protein Pcinc_026789 [Petrolisthes cinctipes]|uniref:DNA-3-methyladenine glycosylase n=1 Tax=Petrolisthes cinctipes TaxID=88211 RepID=A0AAE1F5S6_PETCI|nr:hypothetical protein Pcinc_026789 [Petrolisthes cinctipes]
MLLSVSKSPRKDISTQPTEVIQSPYFCKQENSNDRKVYGDRNIGCNENTEQNRETGEREGERKINESNSEGAGETVERSFDEMGERGTEQVSQGTSIGTTVLWSDDGGGDSSSGRARSSNLPPGMRLSEDFYGQDCITLAKALLGQVVVRVVDGVRISGRIVETESYLGVSDKASHSYNGKRTGRTGAMFMKAGTSYVYTIYGMYYCFNISSQEEGACVLLRALEPLEGLERMQVGRKQRRKDSATPLKLHQLCNGPSKLCQALCLTKDANNAVDLTSCDSFWLESGPSVPTCSIVITKRVGIEGSGEESANKPLRFYEYDSKFVSVRDKVTEGRMQSN